MSETPEMKPISLDNLKRALHTLKNYFLQIKDAIRTVNRIEPDEYGNVQVDEVDFANELNSSTTQRAAQAFVIRTTGGSSSDKDGDAWLMTVQGRSVKTGLVIESITPEITPAGEESNLEISDFDRDVFKGAVSGSGTTTLTYTTEWSEDPALYGLTLTGDPADGDVITIEYVQGERGTISNATPSKFVSTGWNLFNPSTGAARVAKYDFGYRVDGTYTALKFSETFTGTQSAITVTDHQFDIPSDGYVWVEGSDEDTAIYPTWEDWTEGYEGSFETFADGYSYIDLSNILTNLFPYGMCSVGNVADEINLNVLTATQHIERLEYSDANLETVITSGAAYDTDENYIYYVNDEAVPVSIAESGIDGAFTASDHGIEFFEGTEVPAYCQTIYGASLKNKLERDVLTASQQTLSDGQKATVLENLGINFNQVRFGAAMNQANLQQFIDDIKTYENNTIIAYCVGPTIATALLPGTMSTSVNAIVMILKSSANNAYYFMVNGWYTARGNISLANNNVSETYNIPNGEPATAATTDFGGENAKSVSSSSSSATNLGSFTLKAGGTYIIDACCTFAENSTGHRRLIIADTTTGTSYDRFSYVQVPAGSGSITLQLCWLYTVPASGGDKTFYLNARQNSGSPLNVSYPGVKIVRIR